MTTHDDASANDPQVPNDTYPGDDGRFFSRLSEKDRAAIWARILARPVAAVPEMPSDFDRDFQNLVPAKLEGTVRLSAYLVSLELETFELAHRRVMRAARKYGAGHLSDVAFYEFSYWVDRALLAMIDAPAPEGLVSPEALRRMMRETCGRECP